MDQCQTHKIAHYRPSTDDLIPKHGHDLDDIHLHALPEPLRCTINFVVRR
jgi:hypothetical protein